MHKMELVSVTATIWLASCWLMLNNGMQGTMLEQVVDHRLDVPHDG